MHINFVKGFTFKFKTSDSSAYLVIRSDAAKYVVDTWVDGQLVADKVATTVWNTGDYDWQLLNDDGILETGTLKIMPNFALSEPGESVKSHYRQVLDAIDAMLEGRATEAQTHINVGDKSIGYCTFDELIKWRNYFKGKLDEEKAEEAGEIPVNPDSQRVIKYFWR